ncbi:MAG: haloacid dehalogenase [Frondihabitans sp.]|nr:haloacid dehalogenase [Frondihabitans sp.]
MSAATFPYSAVLFDLDGTIADSAPGITATLAFTLEELGLPVPPPAELLTWVGPPLAESFTIKIGLEGAALKDAMRLYRRHYLAVGALDSRPFPGIEGLLRRVHAAGIPTSLATSKPEGPALVMLDHFGLTKYLDVITGASEDEVRSAKADVVEEALARLTARGVDVSRPVLVGDRSHDVEGAAAHGVPTIIVEWGYGSLEERVGAIAVAKDPEDLASLLGLPSVVGAGASGAAASGAGAAGAGHDTAPAATSA